MSMLTNAACRPLIGRTDAPPQGVPCQFPAVTPVARSAPLRAALWHLPLCQGLPLAPSRQAERPKLADSAALVVAVRRGAVGLIGFAIAAAGIGESVALDGRCHRLLRCAGLRVVTEVTTLYRVVTSVTNLAALPANVTTACYPLLPRNKRPSRSSRFSLSIRFFLCL